MKLISAKLLPAPAFLIIFVLAPFLWLSQTSPVFQARLMTLSFSPGVRYYGQLQLWHLLAKAGDWEGAAKFASGLDPADIADFLNSDSPSALKFRYNNFVVNPNKTAGDYLEMAKIQAKLNNPDLAVQLLDQAAAKDPVRSDIPILRYQISN